MVRYILIIVAMCALFCGISLVQGENTLPAGDISPQRREAITLVKRVGVYLRENTLQQALAEINKPFGKFRNHDLYIFILDKNNVMIANGAFSQLINKDAYSLKDDEGRYFVQEIADIANSKGSGWVEYKWPNPTSMQIQTKIVYFEKQNDLIIACGYYVPNK